MSLKKRLVAVGVTTLATAGLAVATAGGASAATCNYNKESDGLVNVGPLNIGYGKGDCGFLYPGQQVWGMSTRGDFDAHATVIGAVPTGKGVNHWLVGFVGDTPIGLYPSQTGY